MVTTPARPSVRAASRMFQTSGYTEAPVTKPTRSRSLSMEATTDKSTLTTSTTGTSPRFSNRPDRPAAVSPGSSAAITASASTVDSTTVLNGFSPAAPWAAYNRIVGPQRSPSRWRISRSRTTTTWAPCLLPPEGANRAASKLRWSWSSVTGSSVKSRQEKVVRIASRSSMRET